MAHKRCRQCKTQPVYEFTNKTKLCKKCFVDYFERKVFRNVRKYEMGMQGIYGNKSDVRRKIVKAISDKIKTGRKLKAKISAGIKNLDDFSTEIIYGIMKKNAKALKKLLPKTRNEEFPLYFLSDKEILLYARLKNIKGKIKRDENSLQKSISLLFSEIEKNDRDARHAVVNALIKIEV